MIFFLPGILCCHAVVLVLLYKNEGLKTHPSLLKVNSFNLSSCFALLEITQFAVYLTLCLHYLFGAFYFKLCENIP